LLIRIVVTIRVPIKRFIGVWNIVRLVLANFLANFLVSLLINILNNGDVILIRTYIGIQLLKTQLSCNVDDYLLVILRIIYTSVDG